MMQAPVTSYHTPPYMPPYAPSTWTQHPVSFQHPVNPASVEGSMVIMPAHPHHPSHNGLGLSPSAYHHSKLDSASPPGILSYQKFGAVLGMQILLVLFIA